MTRAELESKLNELWIARCKANEELLDFCKFLIESGYKIEQSSNPAKQFEVKPTKEA